MGRVIRDTHLHETKVHEPHLKCGSAGDSSSKKIGTSNLTFNLSHIDIFIKRPPTSGYYCVQTDLQITTGKTAS